MGEASAAREFAVVCKARAAWLRAILPSRLSVRTHVAGIILVIVAPLIAFCAYLVLGVASYDAHSHEPIVPWIVILAGGATLAAALTVAAVIGHSITRAITRLVDYAAVLGRGENSGIPATGIIEADAAARSIYLAGERLKQSALEGATLLTQAVTVQEAERKQTARDLHDSLGQYLTALRLAITAIDRDCAGIQPAQQRLAEVKALAAASGSELHRIACELQPMALDDLGLQPAVTQYLEECVERTGLNIDLEINLGDRRLPQPVETALFRVLQTAIGNGVNSGADRIGVILKAADHEALLIVEDNGRGLSEGREPAVQDRGWLGIRERLSPVGGSFELKSSEQGGMTVYVHIPL